jgi:hypothetical protein
MPDEGRDDHRRMGVQLNNEGWDVLEGRLSDESPEQMLYRAYASTFHWMVAGNAINQARGEHLISRTALAIGETDLALIHAMRSLELVESNPGLAEDWDRVFALEAVARARAAGGDTVGAEEALAAALTACEAVAEDDDRQAARQILDSGPWFGLRD